MIDLSNNNRGAIDAVRLRKAGQERVYLKLTEGSGFVDRTHASRRAALVKAGLRVGEYHFARPSSNTPAEEARFFLEHLPKLTKRSSLRPCLDLEDPDASPTSRIGRWALKWIELVHRESGHVVVIYGSPSYLLDCHLVGPPAPLWLASYGRNDGREHPFQIPRPWRRVAAHQYASVARVAGVVGPVDISHVFRASDLDVAVTR